jgi:hypothetical protein
MPSGQTHKSHFAIDFTRKSDVLSFKLKYNHFVRLEEDMKTLVDFPERFAPLVAVTGDRREVPPKTIGDLLAYSVSTTDVMFMSHLCLGECPVVSDKQFVDERDSVLKRRFGNTNILVIGSPAVNLLARKINNQSMFKFQITKETKETIAEQYRLIRELDLEADGLYVYYHCLEGMLNVDTILSRFSGLEPNIKAYRESALSIVSAVKETRLFSNLQPRQRPIRLLMHKLDKPGIRDELQDIIRGESTSPHKDYGLISLFPNPFASSSEFKIIYVAGVHGPGTAAGLKLLSEKTGLTDHPYGGVYEVRLDRLHRYYERIIRCQPRWETPAYKESEVPIKYRSCKKELRVFISSPAKKEDKTQIEFDALLRTRLTSMCEERGIALTIYDPYTLPMADRLNFWDKILEYERSCDLVLHDVTSCAIGVMVEIGFSLGARKPFFLLYDCGRTGETEWNEMNIPDLLPVTQVERIKLTDSSDADDTLRRKILDSAIVNEQKFDCFSCEDLSKNRRERAGFIYSREPEITQHLEKSYKDRQIRLLHEAESSMELKICRICQVIRIADFALIHLTDTDPGSFIVLGISKAMGIKTLPITISPYHPSSFAWEKEVVRCNLGTLEQDLTPTLPMFLAGSTDMLGTLRAPTLARAKEAE